jgi:hypothetical protein
MKIKREGVYPDDIAVVREHRQYVVFFPVLSPLQQVIFRCVI